MNIVRPIRSWTPRFRPAGLNPIFGERSLRVRETDRVGNLMGQDGLRGRIAVSVCGDFPICAARGVDRSADRWAIENGCQPVFRLDSELGEPAVSTPGDSRLCKFADPPNICRDGDI